MQNLHFKPSKTSTFSEENLVTMIQQNHIEVEDRVQGYFQKNYSIIERLFTDKEMAKLVNDKRLLEAKSELEFRNQMFAVATKAKLHAAVSYLENWVKTSKIYHQRNMNAFANEQIIKFTDEVFAELEELSTKVTARLEAIDKQNFHPSIEKMYRQTIMDIITSMYDYLNGQISKFQNVINKDYINL